MHLVGCAFGKITPLPHQTAGFARTETIEFLGALVALNHGGAVVSGIVNFDNGEKVVFFSTPDETAILSERLMSTCQNIAEFYDTEVFHQVFRDAEESKRN